MNCFVQGLSASNAGLFETHEAVFKDNNFYHSDVKLRKHCFPSLVVKERECQC